MDRKYNFHQSQGLLLVDPKTFGRWLVEAKIDPKKQVNRADPRQKWLTEEQIIMLARDHDRPPPSFPKEDEPESPGVTLATVAEQLVAIEHLITQRFTDFQRDLANLEQRITSITQGSQAEVKSPTALPINKPPAARKSTKKTSRGKPLPRNMVPLAAFRAKHGISVKAVEYAVEKNKITVERGKWVRDNRNVVIALGQLGQHEFYALFSEREGFQPCKNCPHATKIG